MGWKGSRTSQRRKDYNGMVTLKGCQRREYQTLIGSGYGSGGGASVVLVEQVAREFKSSSSAICAIDWRISLFSIFLYISELSDLNSMATYSPNVSKSSGSLCIKFNAWLRHSSSDEMVLPDFRFFLFFGEDRGMGAAAFPPSPEFSVGSSGASAGITWKWQNKNQWPKVFISKVFNS